MNVTDPTTEQPIRLLDTALSEVVELGGSDLHVAAGRAPSVRLSGALQTLTSVGIWDADDVQRILSAAMTPAGTRSSLRRDPRGTEETWPTSIASCSSAT